MKSKDHCEPTKSPVPKCAILPATDRSYVETEYLKQLKVTHRARARAGMRWRPRFLKALAMSCGYMFALKAARVCYNTVRGHQRNDPEFAAQVREAEAEGAQLLHDVCWKRVIEGDLEPVYWQGEIVGHIRKFDTRLQIAFLRAYMPDRFKTPGGASVSIATRGDILVLTEAQRARIMAKRREALLAMPTDRAGEDARQRRIAEESARTTCAPLTPST